MRLGARRVRARAAAATLGVALGSGGLGGAAARAAPPAAAPPPIPEPGWPPVPMPILLDEPLSPQLSLSLDGRDWRVLPGVGATLPRLDLPAAGAAGRNRLLAAAEVAVVLGIDSIIYWVAKTADTSAWAVPWSWSGWEKKFGSFDYVAMDSNAFVTNVSLHPFAGTLFYSIGRGNGLGMGESLLLSTAASTFWEYVCEYPERVSINDMILTPMSGIAIGEPLEALSRFFERSGGGGVARALAGVFSPFRALRRQIDGPESKWNPGIDARGPPDQGWHRIALGAGAGGTLRGDGTSAPEGEIDAGAELIDIPEYGRDGRAARPVPGGSATRIEAALALGEGGVVGFDLFSRTSLGGFYWQRVGLAGGEPSGYSLHAAWAAAFSYLWRDFQQGDSDKLGGAHLGGPSIDLTVRHRGARVRAGLDVSGGLFAVQSLPIQDHVLAEGAEGLKASLVREGYYFALGLTVMPSLSVRYRGIELGGELRHDTFESIEGLDAHPEDVWRDFHLQDRRLRLRGRLSFAPPGGGVEVSLIEVERIERSGAIGLRRRALSQTRFGMRARVVF
ncbi:MAG: DUF3943 domain-containing protein [Polyangiaceae bacterium]|nr:DUF3943 domain-containing protein [Polyangiaceae bacterium]